jgi:hypothetical protein
MSARLLRRVASVRPRPATLLASLALLISLGGNAAAAILITSNGQVGRGTISGHKPPSGEHANLIAGSVTGTDIADDSLTGSDIQESSLSGVARRLLFSEPHNVQNLFTLTTISAWTVKAQCDDAPLGEQNLNVYVNGPGEAQVGSTYDYNDGTQLTGLTSDGYGLAKGKDIDVLTVNSDRQVNFRRAWGSIWLRSGKTLVEVDFHAVSDGRTGLQHCFLYGTATLAV